MADYLNEKRRVIDSALDQHMPAEDVRPSLLHTAMRYCVFSNGKRLRPILGLASAAAVRGRDVPEAVLPALAVEVLHTYTLVHDDLPAMDDDALRRGQPTAHIQFGEANAILVGDALLTLAFEWLATCVAAPPYAPGQFSLELAEAAGSRGVIAGQIEDLAATESHPTADQLAFIQLHKTATLLRAAVRMGAIAGHASAEALDQLSLYGCNLGLAFQIVDDILDETAQTDALGKPAGSDRRNKKLTYVSMHGVDASRQRARKLIEEARAALEPLPGDTAPLDALAQFVLDREK